MTEAVRDLAAADLWASSLERSLARRREPKRSSISLASLRPPRDLSATDDALDSLAFSRRRREAAENAPGIPGPAARGLSLAGLVAAIAAPTLVVAGSGGGSKAKAAAAGPRARADRRVAARELSQAVGAIQLPAAKQAAAAKPAAPQPAVLEGSVAEVQRALGVSVTGALDAQTISALRSFQAAHGLKPDAIVGARTYSALVPQPVQHHRTAHQATRAHHSARAQAASVTRTHRAGGGVAALQRALGLTADGVFGHDTEAAVKAYQRSHGLTADGVVGPATRSSLGLGAGPTLHPRHAHRAHRVSSTGGGAVGGVIARMIAAGDAIAHAPYVYGGGHGSFQSSGYDCSGSVSYVLHAGGLLSSPLDSSALESYGQPGPGRHVTIYANAGHAFMVIDGRRFDTIALQETGTRWSSSIGSTSGYVVRHPAGY